MKEKKKTKAVILSCILMLALIFCTGCDSATSGISGLMSEESKLAGVYEYESEKDSFVLAKDGTMRDYGSDQVTLGKFKVEDGTITFTLAGETAMQYDYTFEDDMLTLFEFGMGTVYTKVAEGEETAAIEPNSEIISISGMFSKFLFTRLLFEEDGTVWYYREGSMDSTLEKGSYRIAGGHISLDFESADEVIGTLGEGVNFELDDDHLILFDDSSIKAKGDIWKRTTDDIYQSALNEAKSLSRKSKKSVEDTTTYSYEENYDDYTYDYGDSWYYDDGYTYDDGYEDNTYWEDEYGYNGDYSSGSTSGSISAQTNDSMQEEEQTEDWE